MTDKTKLELKEIRFQIRQLNDRMTKLFQLLTETQEILLSVRDTQTESEEGLEE